MRVTLEQYKEEFLATEKISAVFLDAFKNMLVEIAELYRKKHLLLTKEKLLETTTLYLGYHLVTTFQAESEIIAWVISLLKSQVSLAKELTPLFTQKLKNENIEKLQAISQEEGFSIHQSFDILHLYFELIAENRTALLMQKTEISHNDDLDAIRDKAGLIMENCIESVVQSLHCLYPEKPAEGYKLLLFVLFKPILLSTLILANDNGGLTDFAEKTEEYFEGLVHFSMMADFETIH